MLNFVGMLINFERYFKVCVRILKCYIVFCWIVCLWEFVDKVDDVKLIEWGIVFLFIIFVLVLLLYWVFVFGLVNILFECIFLVCVIVVIWFNVVLNFGLIIMEDIVVDFIVGRGI